MKHDKLPKKFVMSTKYNRPEKYTMEQHEEGMYHITEEAGKPVEGRTAKHTEEFVKACLNEGSWILEKSLDEPELVFPFTAIHKAHTTGSEINAKELFEVTKGYDAGRVTCTYINDGATSYNNCFSVDEVKQYIKEGTWLVQHVGERVSEKDNIEVGTLAWDGTELTASEATFGDSNASSDRNTLIITVNCNTDAAIVSLERFRQAVEDVNISLESMIALQKELKGI